MPNLSLRWSVDTRDTDPEWDRFQLEHPHGHHEQTTPWGRVKRAFGWHPLRLKAHDGDRLVAGVQILLRRVRRFGSIAYLCKGPVLDFSQSDLVEAVVSEVDRWARGNRILYQVIEFPYEGAPLAEAFSVRGYTPHPARLPPSSLMSATMLLDLALGPEELLRRMSPSKRRSIRKSLEHPWTFRSGTHDDVAPFRAMLVQLCRRRNTGPTPPQPQFFHRLWEAFEGTDWLRLFVVELDGKPVNAILGFAFGETFRAWKIGWTGEHAEKNPDEYAIWQCMLWARNHGCRWFDLVSLERESALRLSRGEHPSASWRPDGMTFAKFGFRGEIRILPVAQSRFYHPLARLAYAWGGRWLLESRRVTRWMNRLHRRSATPG